MAEEVGALVKIHEGFRADEQRHDCARSRTRLCAVPETGNDGSHQCGHIRSPDAEGSASENWIGNAGANSGIADQTHQKIDDERAQADRQNKIDETAAQEK